MRIIGKKSNVETFKGKIRKLQNEFCYEKSIDLNDAILWRSWLDEIYLKSKKMGLEIKGYFSPKVLSGKHFDEIIIMIVDDELSVVMKDHFFTNKDCELAFIQGLFEMINDI